MPTMKLGVAMEVRRMGAAGGVKRRKERRYEGGLHVEDK